MNFKKSEIMYLVKFYGSFGFIKPWSAVRDTITKSCDYITPSILMGIERKLFPELMVNDNGKLNKIIRHRLSFQDISFQQETTRSVNDEVVVDKKKKLRYRKPKTSVINRGVLINPILYLLFNKKEDVEKVMMQHICLCRNEDVMFPIDMIELSDENEFNNEDLYSGYESFSSNENEVNSIYCGYNKYTKNKQYITRKIFGTPSNLSI